MKVRVEDELCQGHARCYALCPSVFDLDDGGHAVVRDVVIGPEIEELVRTAAVNCPEGAIVIEAS